MLSRLTVLVCRLLAGLVVAFVASLAGAAPSRLVWDRNTEADMDHYNVYGCFTAGCRVTQDSASKLGSVPQVSAGDIPEFLLPFGQEGALAVSAVAKAPAVPANPRLQ